MAHQNDLIIYKEEYLGLVIEIWEYHYGETELIIYTANNMYLASESRPTAKWSNEYQSGLLVYWRNQIDYGYIHER